jgi:lipoic acid synthetase
MSDSDLKLQRKRDLKTARIPIKVVQSQPLRKPEWIRVRAGGGERFAEIKRILREASLHTVCEEASCPNIGECFGHGTATFMIMGDLCTRRCPFCDVAHGRPGPLDAEEPRHLAETIAALKLSYVVITSVDRDDLRDGGAGHFVDCIRAVRKLSPATRIEILTPDFRGRLDRALEILDAAPPDVMNHNLETCRGSTARRVPDRTTPTRSPVARLQGRHPAIPTKSGLMVGLGETNDEILEVMRDLRAHHVDMLTIGHTCSLPGTTCRSRASRIRTSSERSGRRPRKWDSPRGERPMVRSSYHADRQAAEAAMPDS